MDFETVTAVGAGTLVSTLAIVLQDRSQAIHDLISRTVIVHGRRRRSALMDLWRVLVICAAPPTAELILIAVRLVRL